MAQSGSVTVAATSQNNLSFAWAVTGRSVADNTSTVAWQLQLSALAAGRIVATPGSGWSVSIDGAVYSGTTSIAIENNQTKTLASGTVTIAHGADGSGSFDFSFSQDFYITFGGSYIQIVSGSGTAVLDDIPRASVPSCPGGDLGTELTIATNRAADFTHTLTWAFGSESGTIAEQVTDSCTWTPPLSLAAQIPSATSGAATVTCLTYRDGTLIGTAGSTVTLTVPQSIVPTAEAAWQDTSGAADKVGTLVQNVSALAVEVTGTGIYGSTLRSAAVTLEGAAYSGAVIRASGDLTLRVSVTDSRGRTGYRDYTLTLAPYAVPQLSLDASRCDASGNADEAGDYARITVTGSVTALSGANRASLTVTWGTESVTVAEASYSAIVEAPSVSTLTISAALADALTASSRSMVLSVGYATMDFLAGGRGVAFGTSATREGLECAMAARFSAGLNGLALGEVAFATNTTVQIPITVRTPVLIVMMGNDGNHGVFLAACRRVDELSGFARLAGSLNVTAALTDGVLTLTCPVNWSYGWYITRL